MSTFCQFGNRLTSMIGACLLGGLLFFPLAGSLLLASDAVAKGAVPKGARQPGNRLEQASSVQSSGSHGEASGGASAPTHAITIDYLWPGVPPHYRAALRVPTWVDVPIVSGGTSSNTILIRSLRILTGARNWGFTICGSKTLPETCSYTAMKGWKLWYADSQANISYQDLDGDASPEIHFLVTPFDGDWMSFRAQIEGDLP